MMLMTVRKLSVALEARVAEAAAAEAAAEGLSLSAWLNRAAEKALKISEGLAAVAEYEAEHGAFTDEEMAEARADLELLLGPVDRSS